MSTIDPRDGGEDLASARVVDRTQRRVSGRQLQAARLGALLDRSARGQEDAFADLYDETCARIYGVIVRVIRSAELAAQVTCEVYIEVWREASRHTSDRGGVLAWMTSIAHRRAVECVRADGETSTVRPAQSVIKRDIERDVDRIWDDGGQRLDVARVRKALDTLTETQREAISLSYFGGYTYTQVGGLLGLSPVITKVRIRDGLIGLRDALGVGTA